MGKQKQLSDFERLPKRVQAIIATMRQTQQKLCKSIRHKETNDAEIIYFLEPSGRHCGPKSAAQAIESGLLAPSGDGLLGPESSQTWAAVAVINTGLTKGDRSGGHE